MKKNNKKVEKKSEVSIEEGLDFIASFQKMLADQDETTVAISLRIPKNLLHLLKSKADSKNTKYQTLLVEYVRRGLKADLEY